MRFYLLILALLLGLTASPRVSGAEGEGVSVQRQAERAGLFYQRGFYRDSIDMAEKGMAVSPAYLPFWRALARSHYALGEYGKAREAIAVWRLERPDEPEALELLVRTLIQDRDGAEGGGLVELASVLGEADPGTVLPALGKWVITVDGFDDELDEVLDSLLRGGCFSGTEEEAAKRYREGAVREAAELLTGSGAGSSPGSYAAFLQYLVGRDLGYSGDGNAALPLLERAREAKFLPADCARIEHGIHRGAGEWAKAAKSLVPYWRRTENPAKSASDIAGDFLAARRPEEALLFLDGALRPFPRHPALQAKRMLALHLMERPEELAGYARSLEEKGFVPGLKYGEALIARTACDYAAAEEKLTEAAEYVRNVVGNALHDRDVESWMDGGQRPLDVTASSGAVSFFHLGSRLWGLGARERGFAAWGRALDQEFANHRSLLVFALQRILSENRPEEALAFVRRNLPQFREVDLALTLRENERWLDLKNLTAKTGPGVDGEAWLALTGLRAAIQSGASDGEEDHLSGPLRRLAAVPPETGDFAYRAIKRDNGIAAKTLTREEYDRDMLEAVGDVVRSRREDLFPILLDSPQWNLETPVGFREIGLALFRSGQRDWAGRFFDRLPEGGRDDSEVAYCLAQAASQNNRPMAATAIVQRALLSAKGAPREMLLAFGQRVWGDMTGAAEHMAAAAGLEPEDDAIRLGAIFSRVAAHQYPPARTLLRRFERTQLKGGWEATTYLAQSRMELGDIARALPFWEKLHRRSPNSIPALGGLLKAHNQLETPEKNLALAEAAKKHPTAEITGLMAEAHMALSEPGKALEWLDLGLEGEPENLRLLNLAVRCCEILGDNPKLEDYSSRYLALEPDAPAMHVLHGQSLVNQEKWAEVRQHNRRLLERNPINANALERELERLKAVPDVKGTWELDRYISHHFGNDGGIVIRSAISAASAGKFRYAIPTLERLMKYGPNSSVLNLYFGQIALGEGLEALSWRNFLDQLNMAGIGHRFVGTDALGRDRSPDKGVRNIPLILYFGRNRPEVLVRIDAALRARNGRAVLVVGEESLDETTSEQWPDAGFLRRLVATGRWEFVLTDNSAPRFPGREDGDWTTFWTQRRWLGECLETAEEIRERLGARMRRIKDKAQKAGIEVKGWMHPSWGDFGQRVIEGDSVAMREYLLAAADEFPRGFLPSPIGYCTPETDRVRIPVRSVGKTSIPADVWFATAYGHPTRRAVLELAKVKSWHGQLPEADRLFRMARRYWLDPKEYSYFHARNSQWLGDVPVAVGQSHEARRFDPENERTENLRQDTHRLLRPLMVVTPSRSNDSNHEQYHELDMAFSFHIRPKWELGVRTGFHHWRPPVKTRDDRPLFYEGRLSGFSVGGWARYYFKPLNWLQADVRNIQVDNGVGSIPEAKLTWHGAFAYERWEMNGTFNFIASHEAIMAFGAVKEKITTNRLAFNTNFRYRDWWEVDYENYYTRRSDGNDTVGLMFRPTYRFRDVPLIRAGYWLALADSDRNPDEYYAPVDYQSHSAVVMYQQRVNDKLSVNALASWGQSRSEGKGWQNVVRANAGVTYRPNPCLVFNAGYSLLKLPDYTLNNFNVSVGIRF